MLRDGECQSHIVKQAIQSDGDTWVIRYHVDADPEWGTWTDDSFRSPDPREEIWLDKVLMWLLVEHQMLQNQDHQWTQFTMEPWTAHHLDFVNTFDEDDFICQSLDFRRECGSRQEMEARTAELRTKYKLKYDESREARKTA